MVLDTDLDSNWLKSSTSYRIRIKIHNIVHQSQIKSENEDNYHPFYCQENLQTK